MSHATTANGTAPAAPAGPHAEIEDLPELQPLGPANQELAGKVHPTDWQNPAPEDRYDLVVLGGGTAGLVAAAGAAGIGARVALVEKHLLGGDCLVTGCVPSKALIRAARAAHDARSAGRFGVHAGEVTVDFAALMDRMRSERASIARHDSAARFRDLGVDVFLGAGRFTGPEAVEVDGRTLRFKRAVIATGARAATPPIPGADDPRVLTNHTLFSLTELPERFVVVGGGPIGTEMAQSFARFGSKVTLVEAGPRILAGDDPDASEVVTAALERDGVEVLVGAKVQSFEDTGGALEVRVEHGGESRSIPADRVLLAVGRAPNVDGLGLEAADVRFDPRKGVEVDDTLRTSNKRVYASGDVASKWKFTHAADFLSRTVLRNAFFPGSSKASDLVVPWATYTDPEVAHVGHTAASAREAGLDHGVVRVDLSDNDRAVLDGATEGFVKIVHDRKGRVLGGTVVAEHAGETIGELVTAVRERTKLGDLASVIHPYPTVADAIRRSGDVFRKESLSPRTAKLLGKWMRIVR
ncbi:MAG: mercuric reductase [Planctomycetota bacterium]